MRGEGRGEEARVEQERLLKYYGKKYGEVPPNNNNLPDKHIDWESLSNPDTNPITFPSFMNEVLAISNHRRQTKTGENT